MKNANATAYQLANCFCAETAEALMDLNNFYNAKAEQATEKIIKQFWDIKAFACTIALSMKKEK